MSFGQELVSYAVQFLLMFLFTGLVTRAIKFVLKQVFHSGKDAAAVTTFVVANIVLFGLLLKGRNVGFTFEPDDAIEELALIAWLVLDWAVLPRRAKTTNNSGLNP
jgi:hypothetical protein